MNVTSKEAPQGTFSAITDIIAETTAALGRTVIKLDTANGGFGSAAVCLTRNSAKKLLAGDLSLFQAAIRTVAIFSCISVSVSSVVTTTRCSDFVNNAGCVSIYYRIENNTYSDGSCYQAIGRLLDPNKCVGNVNESYYNPGPGVEAPYGVTFQNCNTPSMVGDIPL